MAKQPTDIPVLVDSIQADASISEEADPMAFHLNACRVIAMERARSTFSHHMSELESAFNADLDNAGASRHNDHLLDKVLMDIRKDVKSMTSAITELNDFSDAITSRQETIDKRASIMQEGKTRLRAIKIKVYEALSQRADGQELPSSLLLFMYQPWTDFLCYSALRYGESSGSWLRALNIVDDLIWAIKPKFGFEERKHHIAMQKTLLRDIRNGFRSIRYDQVKGQNMIKAIEGLMASARSKPASQAAAGDVREALKQIAEEKAFKEIGTAQTQSNHQQKIVKLLRAIEFGTWFEFKNGKRLKVAWYNARTSHYMMVDASGKKCATLLGEDLAKALLNRKARICFAGGKNKPLIIRTLDAIFEQQDADITAGLNIPLN